MTNGYTFQIGDRVVTLTLAAGSWLWSAQCGPRLVTCDQTHPSSQAAYQDALKTFGVHIS